ncbi:MAG: hypothetical protein ACKVQJ_09025 [Pyrinomonadaceae bacterium]
MSFTRLLLLIFMLGAAIVAEAQVEQLSGTILIQGKPVKAGDKLKLARKRFYLFPGGLKDNAELLERIRSAEITSRDCYYLSAKASPEFICWLQRENCDGPFCRAVSSTEVAGVPEFDAAYKKGLTLYRGKTELSLSWLINNLETPLVAGYYDQQRSFVNKILGGLKPLQTTIATITAAEAYFVDVPIGDKAQKYLVSTIVPVDLGDKSYVWTCEVTDLGRNKPLSKLPLPLKTNSKCEVTPVNSPVCKTGACATK